MVLGSAGLRTVINLENKIFTQHYHSPPTRGSDEQMLGPLRCNGGGETETELRSGRTIHQASNYLRSNDQGQSLNGSFIHGLPFGISRLGHLFYTQPKTCQPKRSWAYTEQIRKKCRN